MVLNFLPLDQKTTGIVILLSIIILSVVFRITQIIFKFIIILIVLAAVFFLIIRAFH